jgi:hypothetical protein
VPTNDGGLALGQAVLADRAFERASGISKRKPEPEI